MMLHEICLLSAKDTGLLSFPLLEQVGERERDITVRVLDCSGDIQAGRMKMD